MHNVWVERRLIKDLLKQVRDSGGYSASVSVPWGFYKVLKDATGKIIFQARDHTQGSIISQVIHHYTKGTDP